MKLNNYEIKSSDVRRNRTREFFFTNTPRNGTQNDAMHMVTGADPGFLERGFVCIKVWEFALLIVSHFS